jgi:hypothetical protein
MVLLDLVFMGHTSPKQIFKLVYANLLGASTLACFSIGLDFTLIVFNDLIL